MTRLGGTSQGLLGLVSAHAMRVTGAVGALLAGGVIATSLTTEYGLPADATEPTTVAPGNPALTAETVLSFAQHHPAYLAAVLVGLYFLFAGE